MSIEIEAFSTATLVQQLSYSEWENERDNEDYKEPAADLMYMSANPDCPGHADSMIDGRYRVVQPKENSSLLYSSQFYSTWRSHLCLAMTGLSFDELLRSTDLMSSRISVMLSRQNSKTHRLAALLLFPAHVGLIGPVTCAQIRDEFSAGWDAIEAHVRWLTDLCGQLPEIARVIHSNDADERSELVASINTPNYGPKWLATCSKIAALFKIPGPSGCVFFY